MTVAFSGPVVGGDDGHSLQGAAGPLVLPVVVGPQVRSNN